MFQVFDFVGFRFWKAKVFPTEAQQGILSINPDTRKEEPAEPKPESQPERALLPKAIPKRWQDYWSRLWALHGAARHRKTCLQKRKIRTKCRLQKNMCRGTIRPKRDPKKYHRRTGQWVHEVQTAFQGKCHTEQEGSSG